MSNKLYTWDEISDEIQRRSAEDVFRCNAEGGWITETFYSDSEDLAYGRSVVEVRTNGRHIALETWCSSKKEAHRLFMQNETYYEYNKEESVE